MKSEICFANVEFSAVGGQYERFLTLCSQQNISLQRVRPVLGGISARMPARSFRRAARLARRCRTRLRIQKKCGVYFRLRRLRGRWGLLLAPLVFLVTVQLFGNVVWSIRWQGVETAQQPLVKKALYSMDICEGAVLTQETIRASEKQLMAQLPDLGWISLNFGKGRLVVEAAPSRPKPDIEPNDPVDLIAAADGMVLSTQVEEGILVKKAGQTVAKGDLLIGAGRADRDGRMIPAHAKGVVIAETERIYQCVQPMEYETKAASGKMKTSQTLCAGGHRIPLGKQEEAPPYARVTARPLEVWGFALPATIEETLWVDREAKTIQLTPEQAEMRARQSCFAELARDFPDAKILSEEESADCENGQLTYTLRVRFAANIAKMRM